MNNTLKEYICTVPFSQLHIYSDKYTLCCSTWIKHFINIEKYSLSEVWKSKEAEEFRNSILDGSYKYCDKIQCSGLNSLINFSIPNNNFIAVNLFHKINNNPSRIIYNMDRSCNFKCPSCRINLINYNSKQQKNIKEILDGIDSELNVGVENIVLSNFCDPFASALYRKYLREFKPEKFPNLKSIAIHTNASLWNKKMWDSMPNIHRYVEYCSISIDAATKETYENCTRLNGNWDVLISNLKFINTIESIKRVRVSFVVQKSNYKEMCLFIDLVESIFGNKVSIFFGKINNWGVLLEDEFNEIKIWDENHPEHLDFVKEINKAWRKKEFVSNLNEFIEKEKHLL